MGLCKRQQKVSSNNHFINRKCPIEDYSPNNTMTDKHSCPSYGKCTCVLRRQRLQRKPKPTPVTLLRTAALKIGGCFRRKQRQPVRQNQPQKAETAQDQTPQESLLEEPHQQQPAPTGPEQPTVVSVLGCKSDKTVANTKKRRRDRKLRLDGKKVACVLHRRLHMAGTASFLWQ